MSIFVDEIVRSRFSNCWKGQTGEGSAIDLDMGPPINERASTNYKTIKEILLRLSKLCITETASGKKAKKHEQRLLRNMGACTVVLELLQIPYTKVSAGVCSKPLPSLIFFGATT